MSAVEHYSQNPLSRDVGPMNYSVTVAAILASAVHIKGGTEFDKAAMPKMVVSYRTDLVQTFTF